MDSVDVLNRVRLFIQVNSNGSKLKKDLFAIFLLIYLVSFIGYLIQLLEYSKVLDMIYITILNIEALIKSISNINMVYPVLYLDISFSNIFDGIVPQLLLHFIYIVIPLIILKLSNIFKISNVKSIAFHIVLTIIVNCVIFKISIFGLLFIIILIINFILFCPLGSGLYFAFFENCIYLSDIFRSKRNKIKSNYLALRVVIAIFTYIAYLILLYYYFEGISTYVASIVYFAFISTILVNSSSNLLNKLKINFLFNLVLIVITILNIKSSNNGTIETFTLIATVFYVFDRMIKVMNDIKKIINDSSLLYLIEKKSDEYIWLINNKLEINNYFNKDTLSETELLRQIIIYAYLKDDCTVKLIDMYRTTYDENLKLVLQINYFVRYDNFINNLSRIEYIENISKFKDSKIDFMEIKLEYIYLIFQETDRYEDIIKQLNDIYMFIDDDRILYCLYFSLIKVKNFKVAQKIKERINDFEDVKSEWMD